MSTQFFRAGVAIVISDDDGRVLAFERAGEPGNWQLPQGGIDLGEEPEQAAWREMAEETGLGSAEVTFVAAAAEWIVYELPLTIRRPGSRGQAHRWFHFRVRSAQVEPTVDGKEFTAWQWMAIAELGRSIVGFKHDAYRRGFAALGLTADQSGDASSGDDGHRVATGAP